MALGVLALRGGWWWGMLWGVISCGIVSAGYALGEPGVLGKRRDGTRAWWSWVLLGPYLVMTEGVWRVQVLVSREEAFSPVNHELILSRRLRSWEIPESVGAICDLTAEMRDPKTLRMRKDYHCFPVLDAGALQPEVLKRMVEELRVDEGMRVLIHCANGHGRSGMVGCAWLIASGYAESVEEALKMIQRARPGVRLRSGQRRAVEEFAEFLRGAESCRW